MKQKKAVLMAHYYQDDTIQEIADVIGDSLVLAQQAAKTDASLIVLSGVFFMGETAKIIAPNKKVLIPDAQAGCSLADSCPADQFEQFIDKHPGYTIITYVNTSAAVKALSDIVVTSSNAVPIIQSLPKLEKIIFASDKNLGNYINSITGRQMLLWDGACHVHERFSIRKIVELKEKYPEAKIIAHPECKQAILTIADFIGSTAALLKYVQRSDFKEFIVATEPGILFEMKKTCPGKSFIPAPPEDSTCGCSECEFMKLNTLEKIRDCLIQENPSVEIPDVILKKARKPIERMLELSQTLAL
jgi:quinolinate synthase